MTCFLLLLDSINSFCLTDSEKAFWLPRSTLTPQVQMAAAWVLAQHRLVSGAGGDGMGVGGRSERKQGPVLGSGWSLTQHGVMMLSSLCLGCKGEALV